MGINTDAGATVAVTSMPAITATATIGAALPAGDNNIGNVDVTSLPASDLYVRGTDYRGYPPPTAVPTAIVLAANVISAVQDTGVASGQALLKIWTPQIGVGTVGSIWFNSANAAALTVADGRIFPIGFVDTNNMPHAAVFLIDANRRYFEIRMSLPANDT